MELEELEAIWGQLPQGQTESELALHKLIHQKSRHPLLLLTKRFRRGMILIPVIYFMITRFLSNHHSLFDNTFFLLFTFFCIATTTYFIVSYCLIRKITLMDENVVKHVQQQMHLLEKLFRWRKIGTRCVAVALIIIVEVTVHFQSQPPFKLWALQPLPYRIIGYAFMMALFYGITQLSFKYRYEKYILHLKSLLVQIK